MQIYAFFSLFVVILSTVIFILTTLPELDEFYEIGLNTTSEEGEYKKNEEVGVHHIALLLHIYLFKNYKWIFASSLKYLNLQEGPSQVFKPTLCLVMSCPNH